MLKWLKKKLGINRLEDETERLTSTLNQSELKLVELEKANARLKDRLLRAECFIDAKLSELKEYTRVDADVGFRGNNTIILTGVFRKKAYVRFYDLGDGDFEKMAYQLRDMQKHCLIRHLDEPPSFNFRGMFDLD